MTLSLTVLGCSGSYAAPGDACSGYLIRSATTSIWLDTGPGTLANVQQHVALEDIDGLIVSHEHPDHCGELAVLYNAFKWYVERSDVAVFAPEGVERVVRASCQDSSDIFAWTIVSDGASGRIGDIDFAFERTDHSVETMAVRLECDSHSIIYTADTGPRWDPSTFAQNADLMIGEGTVLHADRHDELPHISARELGERAQRSGVRRLVVTHISPGADRAAHLAEASQAFGATAELATTHSTYTTG